MDGDESYSDADFFKFAEIDGFDFKDVSLGSFEAISRSFEFNRS
jgi:hypothetical protein